MSHRLDLIDNSRTDWKVRARITRMWPSFNENQHFVGFNLILLDAENYHVHAFAPPSVWNSIGNIILEGNAYDFENLKVKTAPGRMRPVSSDKFIVLTHITVVHPVPLEAITIPRHKFELVDLGEVHELAASYPKNEKPLIAIDIVGAVLNLQPVKHLTTKFGEKTMVQFHLYDGRNAVKVTAWDEHVNSMAPLFDGNLENPTMILMSTVEPRIFNQYLQISTARSSRIWINIDYEPVREIRRRIIDQGNVDNAVDP